MAGALAHAAAHLAGRQLPRAASGGAAAANSGLAAAPTLLLLRNPHLLPFQLAGMLVALFGLRRLQGAGHTYLRYSLLFFGGMNASSILCHTLSYRGTRLWRASLLADVALTGASSACLLVSQVLPAPTSAATAAAAARSCWTAFLLLLALVVGNERAQLPWVPEAVYLGLTLLAAAFTGHRLVQRWTAATPRQRSRQLAPLSLAALAVGCMQACLPLDPLLCAVAGPWLGTTQMLFGGSALGFAAIVLLAGEGWVGAGGRSRQGMRMGSGRARKAE